VPGRGRLAMKLDDLKQGLSSSKAKPATPRKLAVKVE
jgi:hypothetical protein